jgi:hypothetical protein
VLCSYEYFNEPIFGFHKVMELLGQLLDYKLLKKEYSSCGSVCSHLLTLVPRLRIFLPSRWRRYVPPKRLFTQDLHGATSQMTAFFLLNLILYFHNCVLLLFYLILTLSFRQSGFTRSYSTSTTHAEVCL